MKKKSKKQIKENLNNSELSEDLQESESFTLNNDNTNNKLIIEEENKNPNNNLNNKEEKENENEKDIFEEALSLLDENYQKGLIFEKEFEPNFWINYPYMKFKTIPLFTPSTRLNKALQVEEKNECFIYYYTHKKSLYPTIYNQLIGISGSGSMISSKEKDFIYADSISIIFTNQKNFINLEILLNEYISPLLDSYKTLKEEERNLFIDKLLNNIYINEYLTYEELFIKINELNINIMEHKINNIGLIIIDGLNSINSKKVELVGDKNGKGYTLHFAKNYIPYKADQISNRKKKRNSTDNNRRAKSSFSENIAIKENLFGYNSVKKRNNNDNYDNNNKNEIMQQNIVSLIMNYQEKYNFNLILTVFDYIQYNFYNLNISGKASFKEMNKNTYVVNNNILKKENCYFTFKLPKNYFPKKIIFLEPINLCVNYNEYIFGLITNPINTLKLEFQVFKKEKNDYRPIRIVDPMEYEYKQ